MSAVVINLPLRNLDPPAIPDRAEYIERLREILSALEADDQSLFEARLNQLMRAREEGLFVNLAKLTRELHQAVKDLNFDERLQQLAGSEIPDACVRLDYVVKLGEDAAHKTLDVCDDSRGLINRLNGCVDSLDGIREKLPAVAALPIKGLTLANEIERVEQTMREVGGALRTSFSTIAQAQEYQDLSGQVIRRVIALVHNIEGALIKLLKATNEGVRTPSSAAVNGELAGPTVPGLSQGGQSQQDADALLAELGF
jgi:chemotaxis protein CheZ